MIQMSNGHRATISFQYSIKGNLKFRSFASVTTQVYGNTVNDVMKTQDCVLMNLYKRVYPKWIYNDLSNDFLN